MTKKPATRRAAGRQPPRHYTIDMDVDEAAHPITMDARSLTLPMVAVVSVVISSMWFTYFLVSERGRLDKRIDTVVTSVERLAASISELASGLEKGLDDRFTYTDFNLYCARAETLNKNWRCPTTLGDNTMSRGTQAVKGALGAVGSQMNEVRKGLGESTK